MHALIHPVAGSDIIRFIKQKHAFTIDSVL